jgi:trehalose 6-phosphate synthase
VARAICEGLLACDVIGMQTGASTANFLDTCAAVLPEAWVDRAAAAVTYRGRRTRVRAYPISIDLEAVARLAGSAEVASYRRLLAQPAAERLIVRVDRLDPSKNVARGFAAFERLLESQPEWRGRVRFLACLVPTRSEVPEYQRCREEAFGWVERINARFGDAGWRPVEVLYENNYAQAIAALSLADVTLVNPLADGMNLVAKEAALVNRRDGVLVLSRRAGAYEELGEGALGIAPEDVAGTAEALAGALAMPADERRRRAARLRGAVFRRDVSQWLEAQLVDLLPLRDQPRWASVS